MAIAGYLTEYSLAEIFQLLEQGQKTGLLTVRSLFATRAAAASNYYIWFKQGRIVAAADRLDGKGLISLMAKRGWLSVRAAQRLSQDCPQNMAMGLCFKSKGALQADQLKLLFFVQVMQQVCALFKLDNGFFQFDPTAAIPAVEMTGLSKPATELTLIGLRALRNWGDLAEKLPAPTSALTSLIFTQPTAPLNAQEWQVWEYTNGTTSIEAIALQLHLPVEKVQQIAFRLIVIGIAEEVPIVAEPMPQTPVFEPPELEAESQGRTTLSQAFLQNLVSFLRSKA